MLLDRFLRDRDVAELKEFFSFWDGDAAAPDSQDALIGVLQERMTDEELVRKRLRFLSKKLLDVLRYLLRCDAFRASLSQILGSRLFSYMSQYEVTAALNAPSRPDAAERVSVLALTRSFGCAASGSAAARSQSARVIS